MEPLKETLFVGVTSLDFGNCRDRWFFRNVDRMRKQELIRAREGGTLFHAFLQGYYTARKNENAERYDCVENGMEFLFDAYEEMLYDYDAMEATAITELYEDIRDICKHYEDAFENFEVIAVEEKVAYTDSYTNITIRGQIDLVLRDQRGELYLVDHKTRRAFSTVPYDLTLSMDKQVLTYAWLWWKHTGERPDYIVHNEVRRKAPTPPNVLKNGDLSRAQTTLNNTTAALYAEAIVQQGLSIEDYSEELAQLENRGNQFIRQTVIPINDTMVINHNMTLRYMFDEILRAVLADARFPNASVYACNKCEYKDVCLAKLRGENYEDLLNDLFTFVPAESLSEDDDED